MMQSDGTPPGSIAGWIGIAFAVALTLPSTDARAQAASQHPAPSTQEPRPWANGVSEAEQALALELYHAANAKFAESRFAEALVTYREAIRHWDHPAIRYNMAICLMNMDLLVEAKDSLDQSLVHGERPLGAALYEQGLRFRARLAAQLATLEITSHEPGTEVALDGELRFKAPGAAHAIVMPGIHQIVATNPALPTLSHTVVLVAGTTTRFSIERKVTLVGGDIRHALEIEERTATRGHGPPPTDPQAPTRRPAAPPDHPRPGLPPPPLRVGPRPQGLTWEAGLGITSAWARSSSGSRAPFNAWHDAVTGTGTASMQWSDPARTWSLSLGGGRWLRDDLAVSLRVVWTWLGFTDGTLFDFGFVGASLQYWPADHFWIGGGPGYARVDIYPGNDDEESHRRLGFGQDLRAGYTFNTSSKITINLSIELTSAIFSVTSGPGAATVAVFLGAQRSMAPE